MAKRERAKIIDGLRMMGLVPRPVASPRSPSFKHFTTCTNCGILVGHMGQHNTLTGADEWHVRQDADLSITFSGDCRPDEVERYQRLRKAAS